MPRLTRNLSILLVCWLWHPCFAQEATFEKEVSFKIIKATDTSLSIKDILNRTEEFELPRQFAQKTDPNDIYWVRLDFENSIASKESDATFYLKHNTFDYGAIYHKSKSGIAKEPIGQFDKNPVAKKIKGSNYYSYLEFNAQDLINDRYLMLKVQRITFKEDISNWHFNYSTLSPDTYGTPNDFYQQIFYGVFAGICLIMFLSTLSFFFFLRKIEFLFYSIYLLTLFIYVAGDILGIYNYIFSSYGIVQHWFSQSFILFADIAYGLFFMYYIRTKKDYPFLHLLMLIILVIHVLVILVMMVFYSYDYLDGLNYITGFLMKIVYALSIIVMAYIIINAKNALAYFIGFASIAFLTGHLSHAYYADTNDGLLLNSRYYLLIGASIEIIIFAFGLNYKANLEFRENYRLREEALINKIKALRAQINPHFIFNALGSIQYQILNNQNPSALDYLTKFSRLMRNVLESSIETNIPLGEEIEMLKDYLELESLRFNNSFTYNIQVDENLDETDIEVPSMVLQPFVENALIHGLLPKKEGAKELVIQFKTNGQQLLCIVDDSGLGRQSAKNKTRIYPKEKKSRGLEVTRQRLESLGSTQDPIQIIDKFDDDNRPLGTTVIIKIPI